VKEENTEIMRKLYIFLMESKHRFEQNDVNKLLNSIETAPNFVPTISTIRNSKDPE